MEDESLYVNEGMENIKKTQSALQSLETKLNQYVSRSRDSNEKKIKQPNFIMPAIYFEFSNKKETRPHSYKTHKQSIESTPQQAPCPTPPLESEFEYYKHRLKSVVPTNNLSKIEEFYQKRTNLLEEKVRELEDRRIKIKRDKELLAKENQRINGEIDKVRQDSKVKHEKLRLQTETIENQGRKAKQDRIKQLKEEIKREKEIGQGLNVQVDSYQSSLKLMLELQKNLTTVDVESRELKKRSIGSKSKSTVMKQPPNKHRHCCSSTFTSTQKVKSKSVIGR